MADTFTYRTGPKTVRRIPIASGTVVENGDLLKLASGRALRQATTTDNLTFIGVAAEAHTATDPSGSIDVYVPNPLTVFEYDLDSATDITYGDALQWNDEQKVKKATTDAIATAVESKLSASNILLCFRIPNPSGNLGHIGDAS